MENSKLKVAVVTESFFPQLNGVTNSVARVLETLRQREHEAILIAPTVPSTKFLGYDCYSMPAITVSQFPVALPFSQLDRALEGFGPDVLHVAAPFMLGSRAIGWGKRNSVASVAVYQTDLSGYLERYGLKLAKPAVDRMFAAIHEGATLNLAPTPTSASYLRNLGVPGVDIWGRGVDSDLFHPNHKQTAEAKLLRRQISPDDKLVVGYVGRLAPEKQVWRMAELFGLDARFVVVGDGPERARLEQGFAGHPVTFLGEKSGLDLARSYAAIDIFVHFGTEETFGQVIQEAQATGVPVVAPAVGGPLHLIDPGVQGLLVDPEAPLAYRRAVERLLSDRALSAQMGEAGRRRVLSKTWSRNNSELLGHYRSAMSSLVQSSVR